MNHEHPPLDALVSLYDAVGWTAYTADPDCLDRAVAGSSWTRAAWDGDRLVGFARAVSDGATVCLLQDVLVHPEHRRTGLGTGLVRACLDAHADVRQFVLLTDDRPEQHAFYRALGLSDIATLRVHRLHAFVRYVGVDLQ